MSLNCEDGGGLRSPAVFFLVLLLLGASPSDAEPYRPAGDDEVIEVLPASFRGAESATLLQFHRGQRRDNLTAAVQAARHALSEGRRSGDLRFFGHAEAILRPWYDAPTVPRQVRLLRAYLRQHAHDFAGALGDLDHLLREDPKSAQAWLTKASIHFVRGEFEEARKCCIALSALSQPFATAVCSAEVASKTGHADEALDNLQQLLRGEFEISSGERVWALTLLGDTAERLDRVDLAERTYRLALDLEPSDPYTLTLLSDLLLRLHRPGEVVEILRGREEQTALLLRKAIALRVLKLDSELVAVRDSLMARLDGSEERNGPLHLRERVLFRLYVLVQPAEALVYARENWETQREGIDARLLAEAALRAGMPEAVQPVAKFQRENSFQDHSLQLLLSRSAGQDRPNE